jgi:hypothetical protein
VYHLFIPSTDAVDETGARAMKKIIIVFVVLAALLYGALSVHVIITDDGLKVLKKAELSFAYTLVDARGINKLKLFTNPALLKAGIKDALD